MEALNDETATAAKHDPIACRLALLDAKCSRLLAEGCVA